MSAEKRRRTGTLVRKVFETLLTHPEGLHFSAIVRIFSESESLNRSNDNQATQVAPWSFEEVAHACIASIKAGWLVNKNDTFVISATGLEAYARYQDPEVFMTEAARLSIKGWLSVYLPRYYSFAGKVKDRITVEHRFARRIGLRRLLREALAPTTPWQDVLPIQVLRRHVIPGLEIECFRSLLDYLNTLNAPYGQGRHAIYLPPEAVRRSAFRVLTGTYPPNAGLKIVKNQGGIEDGGYVTGMTKGDSLMQLGFVHRHCHLTLVANLLYSAGIGPRLYDLVELQCGSHLWTAYVVEHVGGSVPSISECESGIKQLRSLEEQGLIKVILPDGFEDEEFACPQCSGNALMDQEGRFKYIDFQNFFLVNYESLVTAIAAKASKKTHFGDRSLLRGGRYLYQSVPAVKLPGKRDVDERMTVLNRLMELIGVSIQDRLVLDVGCNIGMMMGQYLKAGAKWCHGWDRAYVTPHTEKLLLALGCTRFSTTGVDISESRDLEADLEGFLRRDLDGCVISYLAVRAHLGWLQALGRIPWYFLIYEGHEGESRKDFENDLDELKRIVNFKMGAVSEYVDGDSDPRTIAILTRADH